MVAFFALFLIVILGGGESTALTHRHVRSRLETHLSGNVNCQGGEHRNFLTKHDRVPAPDDSTTTCTNGSGETIPVQRARARSSGECKDRDTCALTPTATRQGANGCEKEPNNIVCCSETPCDVNGVSGVCKLTSKCEGPDFRSVSDIVYAGTTGGATGCRHLPDDVMCCVPVEKEPEPVPPQTCDECGVDDLKYCLGALDDCATDCVSDPTTCLSCLETNAAQECCPCIKKHFPSVGNVVCSSGPCSRCAGAINSCPQCASDAANCVSCLASKDLTKCCNCARKFFPSLPSSFTCEFSDECQGCSSSISQCVTAPNAPCCSSGGSPIRCASCILKSNAEDCCDCMTQAASQTGVSSSLPIPCPFPSQCNTCGNALTSCEDVCVKSRDVIKCGRCLDRNGGLQCCDCLRALGVPGLNCPAINAAVNNAKAASAAVTGTAARLGVSVP